MGKILSEFYLSCVVCENKRKKRKKKKEKEQ